MPFLSLTSLRPFEPEIPPNLWLFSSISVIEDQITRLFIRLSFHLKMIIIIIAFPVNDDIGVSKCG